MGIVASSQQNTPREIVPAGNYVARCYQMIHVGTNYDAMFDKHTNKVRVTWELPTELRVFDETKGEQPMVISKPYTLSMHEKANLRKDLESWRGKGFTDDEAKGFDITALTDKWCMLMVAHKEGSNGNTYAYISSIAAIPKGMPVPEAHNPVKIFDYENNYDIEFVETLPDFIKDDIKSSNEWEDCQSALHEQENERHIKSINNDDSELAF